jgi:hypothetical protein
VVLREASWEELTWLIGPEMTRVRLNEWAGRYGVRAPVWERCSVRLEGWAASKIGEVLGEAARLQPRLLEEFVQGVNMATTPPRVEGLPIAVVYFGQGRFGFIDGKHRANKWKQFPGTYAVYVCDARA